MATPLSPVATPPPSTDPTNFFAWVFETNRRDLACTYALHAELGAVLVFATVYNVHRILLGLWFRNRAPAENRIFNTGRAARAWLRKYLGYSTVPTPYFFFNGTEALLLALYSLTLVILAFSGAQSSPYVPSTYSTLDGFSGRCAYLFVASLPWIVALGSKNNVISLLTGIDYERLQVYHRSIARLGLLLVLTHVITKLARSRSMDEVFRRYGMAGFVVAIVLWLVATRNVMRKAYQLFVHLHVILFLGFGVCIWFHTGTDSYQGENLTAHLYLLITAAIWVADRVLRLVKMVKTNVSWRKGSGTAKVTGMILAKDMLRLEVHKPGLQDWSPGQHVYLASFPKPGGLSRVFEAHPFTIASVPAIKAKASASTSCNAIEMEQQHEQMLPHRNGGDEEFANGDKSLKEVPTSETPSSTPSSSPMVFYILARSGFTRRLYERIESGQPLHLQCYGPYSRPTTFSAGYKYETVVLLAGGAGVSWTMPLLLDLCRRATQRTTHVRQIVWIWCVSSSESIPWITAPIASALKTHGQAVTLDVRVHITQEHAHRRQPPREWTEVASGTQRAPWIVQGRPNFPTILQACVDNAAGRIWIGVCGPTSMNLSVRSYVREMIDPRAVYEGDYASDITIHTETFSW